MANNGPASRMGKLSTASQPKSSSVCSAVVFPAPDKPVTSKIFFTDLLQAFQIQPFRGAKEGEIGTGQSPASTTDFKASSALIGALASKPFNFSHGMAKPIQLDHRPSVDQALAVFAKLNDKAGSRLYRDI